MRAGTAAGERLILLDRDGTLNVPVDRYVLRAEDLVLLPGAAEAVAIANSCATVVLVTNQQGVGRGLMSSDDLEAVHESLRQQLAAGGAHLDAIYVCPHLAGSCDCRKPLDGMFRQALADHAGISPADCVVIGDRPTDVIPALRLGMAAFMVCDETSADEVPAGAVAVGSVLDAVRLLESGEGWARP